MSSVFYTIHPSAEWQSSPYLYVYHYCFWERFLNPANTRLGDLVMPATQSAAYGMYPQNAVLPEIMGRLRNAGFEKQDICMVLSPSHPMASVVRDAKFPSAEPSQSARMIAWFSQFGAVVIPAVGFFIRSQAFLRALMMEQNPTLGGGSRMLAGLGFSADEALRLHRALQDAGALVYVSCPESEKAKWALELLRSMGAREVASLEHNEMVQAATAS